MTYDLIGGEPSPEGDLDPGDVMMGLGALEEAEGGECCRGEEADTLREPDTFNDSSFSMSACE